MTSSTADPMADELAAVLAALAPDSSRKGGLTDADFPPAWGDTIPGGAFSNRTDMVGVVTIPDRFRRIGDASYDETSSTMLGAFEGCANITEVRFPSGFVEIGKAAFYGCCGLAGFEAPDTLAKIGAGAFLECAGLTYAAFPDTLVEIGHFAFSKCRQLTVIWIPGSLLRLGAKAFHGCTGLRDVTMYADVNFEAGASTGVSEQFGDCINLRAVSAPAEAAARFPRDAFNGCGSSAVALSLAASPEVQLWYYWRWDSHNRSSPAARRAVFAVVLVGHRLRNADKQAAHPVDVAGLHTLLALPDDLWRSILGFVPRHQLGGA